MIGEILRMREIQPNRHLLAAFELPEVRMSWLWALYPLEGGRTRLVVRLRGHSELEAPGLLMGVAGFFVNYGGFVMERRMMQGIKDRAEGRIEPPWYQGSGDRPVAGGLRPGGGRRGGLRGPPGLVEGTGRRPGRFVGPAVADLRAAVSLGPGAPAAASGRRRWPGRSARSRCGAAGRAMQTPWIEPRGLERALARNEAFWSGDLEDGPAGLDHGTQCPGRLPTAGAGGRKRPSGRTWTTCWTARSTSCRTPSSPVTPCRCTIPGWARTRWPPGWAPSSPWRRA